MIVFFFIRRIYYSNINCDIKKSLYLLHKYTFLRMLSAFHDHLPWIYIPICIMYRNMTGPEMITFHYRLSLPKPFVTVIKHIYRNSREMEHTALWNRCRNIFLYRSPSMAWITPFVAGMLWVATLAEFAFT
jgi:hypothetical protein